MVPVPPPPPPPPSPPPPPPPTHPHPPPRAGRSLSSLDSGIGNDFFPLFTGVHAAEARIMRGLDIKNPYPVARQHRAPHSLSNGEEFRM